MMKLINFLIFLLVVLDSIGIIYIKILDKKINAKIDEIDNAIFEHMKDEYNEKAVENTEENEN